MLSLLFSLCFITEFRSRCKDKDKVKELPNTKISNVENFSNFVKSKLFSDSILRRMAGM